MPSPFIASILVPAKSSQLKAYFLISILSLAYIFAFSAYPITAVPPALTSPEPVHFIPVLKITLPFAIISQS